MLLRRLLLLFCIVLLQACKPAYNIQKTEQTTYIFSDSTYAETDSSIDVIIAPYREKLTVAMSEVLGQSETPMQRGLPESKLGNFVSHACLTEAEKIYTPLDSSQIDFIFLNNGGLRKALPEGNITRGDIYELMPFENELVVLSADGRLVKNIFNFMAFKNGGPVEGVRFQISDSTAINIFIRDNPVDTLKSYKILTSDYLANGGDSFDFLKGVQRVNLNLKVRDALISYITRMGKQGLKINATIDGRISHVH
jgi:2',3'-cyclic-nucleotide 2'-phosphodiesterase (5'-nucleotidase family)